MWEDYAKSVGKTTNQLTQQEKINAEVNGILQETKFQVGDAAKYADTFAGKTARLSQTFYTLKNAIGNVVMPIANLFIPVIQSVMEKLTSFFNLTQQVMILLGFKMGNVLQSTSKEYSSLGSSALAAADDISKANKKANSIMNYDELNVLKKNNSLDTNSGGTSSGTGNIPKISDVMPKNDEISPKANKIANNIKKALGVVDTAFKKTKNFVTKNWDNIVAIVGGGAATITTALLGIKIAKFISNLSKLGGATGILKSALAGLSAVVGGLSAPVVATIGVVALLAGGFTYLYLKSTEFKDSVNEIFKAFNGSLQGIFSLFTTTIIPSLITGFNSFIVMVQPLVDFVSGVLTEAWSKFLQPALLYIANTVLPTLTSTFENLWNNILIPLGAFIASILEPTIKVLIEALEILWKNVGIPLADFIGSTLSSAFEGICEIYNKTLIPTVNTVISVWQFLWTNVLQPIVNFLWDVFKPTFTEVCQNIGNIFSGLKTVFNGVINFVTGVFTLNWKKAWSGIKDIFSGVWTTLSTVVTTPLNMALATIEGFINKVIDGFNLLKKGINKISFDVPDWVPGIGGKKWGFNIAMTKHVSLPRLWKGGWVEPNKPRPVIVGDNKKEGEIIAPESKIYDQVVKANRDTEKTNNNSTQRLILEIHVKYPDGREMIKEINDTQIKDGKITLLT